MLVTLLSIQALLHPMRKNESIVVKHVQYFVGARRVLVILVASTAAAWPVNAPIVESESPEVVFKLGFP